MRKIQEHRIGALAVVLLGTSLVLAGCGGGGVGLGGILLSALTITNDEPLTSGNETIIRIPFSVEGQAGEGFALTFQYTLAGPPAVTLPMTAISPGTAALFGVMNDLPTSIPAGGVALGTFYWQAGADLGFIGTPVNVLITAISTTDPTLSESDARLLVYTFGNGSFAAGAVTAGGLTPGSPGSTGGRSDHGAHIIDGGTDGIIMDGGFDSNAVAQGVDQFTVDVANRTFGATSLGLSPLEDGIGIDPRVNQSASFYFDGDDINVLVTGGRTAPAGSPLASAIVYNFGTPGTLAVGPAMVRERAGHTTTWLPNNTILVTGGEGLVGTIEDGGPPTTTTPQTAEIFDPVASNFTQITDMPFSRTQHTASLLPDGRVLVAGGFDPDSPTTPLNAVIYNPATNTWSDTGVAIDRYQHSASLLVNGVVYLVGGRRVSNDVVLSDAHAYRTFTQVFGTVTFPAGFSPTTDPMTQARAQHATSRLGSGSLLVVGGFDDNAPPLSAINSSEIFTPTNFTAAVVGNFSPIAAQLLIGRARHTVVTVPSGSAIVAGGVTDDSGIPASFVSTIEVYQFNNTAPVASNVTLGPRDNPVDVLINFSLADAEGDRSFVIVRYSSDGGATFNLCTLNDYAQTVNLAAGPSLVHWNATADGLTPGTPVIVQVIPAGGVLGSAASSGSVNF